jgi:hypothetical protein
MRLDLPGITANPAMNPPLLINTYHFGKLCLACQLDGNDQLVNEHLGSMFEVGISRQRCAKLAVSVGVKAQQNACQSTRRTCQQCVRRHYINVNVLRRVMLLETNPVLTTRRDGCTPTARRLAALHRGRTVQQANVPMNIQRSEWARHAEFRTTPVRDSSG